MLQPQCSRQAASVDVREPAGLLNGNIAARVTCLRDRTGMVLPERDCMCRPQQAKGLTVVSGSRLTSLRVLLGLYVASSAPQQIRLPMKAMGSATANQLSQETELPPLPISWMAKMFCGEEMGLVIPPRLDAKAIPANGIDPSLLLANDFQTEEGRLLR